MSFEKYNNGKYARYTSGGMPLVTIPCDLFHAVQNYSPFVFNCELLTLAETAAFLATQPESEGL